MRLIGIDTPEREASKRETISQLERSLPRKAKRDLQRAKQFNISHVKGQIVSLTLDDPPRDRHGRLLAYVYLPDGRLLNRVLIEQGLAVVYRRFEFRLKEEFLAAEGKARLSGIGLWAKDK